MENTKQNYTRQEIIDLIDELLQDPDKLIDAVQNENTDWHGETLLEDIEEQNRLVQQNLEN